jgi:hypothetical protein
MFYPIMVIVPVTCAYLYLTLDLPEGQEGKAADHQSHFSYEKILFACQPSPLAIDDIP